jgi:hypothetical protein
MKTRLKGGLRWDLVEYSFGGSLKAGGWFCVDAFGRNLGSITVKIVSHLMSFIKTFCRFCSFSSLCKDNAAINCIIGQLKKGSFP